MFDILYNKRLMPQKKSGAIHTRNYENTQQSDAFIGSQKDFAKQDFPLFNGLFVNYILGAFGLAIYIGQKMEATDKK